MNPNYRLILISVVAMLCASCGQADGPQKMDRLSGKRILWDRSTMTRVFTPGNYARMIQLTDGTLAAVAEAQGGTRFARSTDGGETWSAPIIVAERANNISMAVPEILQLRNGNILVTYNPRPGRPYTPDRKFGIRAKLSSDKGETWSDEIFVYDAQHTFRDGCWEPVQIQLPSGEIQLFFANENDFTESDEQCISMCRSTDGGHTWSTPQTISFRSGHRDGMPVPLILEDKGEIILAIEDNGVPGYVKFRPSILRTTIDGSWSDGTIDGDSPRREDPFASPPDTSFNYAAPYIRRLASGEVMLGYQGSEGRPDGENFQQMFVWIGDQSGRNMRYKTAPFALPAEKQGNWNSLSVIDGNVAVALTSSNLMSRGNDIWMIKGYPTEEIEAFCTGQSRTRGVSLPIGYDCDAPGQFSISYDPDNLYIHATVRDTTPVLSGMLPEECDGIAFYIDMGRSMSMPSKSAYSFIIGANGTIAAYRGSAGTWEPVNSPAAASVIEAGEQGYSVEAAIPWIALATTPAKFESAAATVGVRNITPENTLSETLPGTLADAPYTWMRMSLK